MTFKGCGLFGDDEHCVNESIASETLFIDDQKHNYTVKTEEDWIGGFPIIGYIYNINLYSEQKLFQIPNVCPFGFVGLKINISEKNETSPVLQSYYAVLYENNLRTEIPYIYKDKISFHKKSEKEFEIMSSENDGIYLLELYDTVKEGPKDFVVGLYMSFRSYKKYSQEEIDVLLKDIIYKVEFIAEYTKYN